MMDKYFIDPQRYILCFALFMMIIKIFLPCCKGLRRSQKHNRGHVKSGNKNQYVGTANFASNKKWPLQAHLLFYCFAALVFVALVEFPVLFHSATHRILIDLLWLPLSIFNSSLRKLPSSPTPSPSTSHTLYPPSALTYMVVTWPRLPGLAFYGKSAGDKATGFKVLSLPVL